MKLKPLAYILLIFCFGGQQAASQTSSFNIMYTGITPQAQIAFEYAANMWSHTVISPVPIKVNVNFIPLGTGTLGITFPNGIKNFAGAPSLNTWYATSLANAITGIELNPGQNDVDIYLNSSENWFFDTTGIVPGNAYDFVSVALHELCHGLGFVSVAKKSGTDGSFGLLQSSDFFPLSTSFPWPNLDSLPSAFDRFIVNALSEKLDSFANPSTVLGTQLTGGQLFFSGPQATAANNGMRPKLYSPATFALGSSILHLDEITYPPGSINELMTPNGTPGQANHTPGPICIGILKDIGWTTNAVSVGALPDAAKSLNIFPNPAHQFVHLQYAGAKGLTQLNITTIEGQLIKEKNFQLNAGFVNDVEIDIRDLAPGIYFVNVKANKKLYMKK